MDKTSLEKNLANMERELVALQTAHEIGIGTVKFYKYGEYTQHLIPYGSMALGLILFEAKDGENINPLLQAYTDMIRVETVKSSVIPNRYVLYLASSFDWAPGITWEIVSSSLLNWHYADSIQDAEDWLGEPL